MIYRSQQNHRRKDGFIIIQSIVFASIAVLIMGALVSWAGSNIKLSRRSQHSEQAIQIAEAGIDYYRWHLAHAPQDYQDGTGQAGPYTHTFEDKDNNTIGNFVLTITAPPTGTTLVKISSVGNVDADPNASRTIESKLAIASFAKYAFVSNSNMRFGAGTEVFGPMHSNGGIRFDGLAHNVITSAQSKYIDTDVSSTNYQMGVYTSVSPSEQNNDTTPPVTLPSRPDVFIAGRQLSVPAVDFTGLTSNLAQIKTSAQSASGKYYAGSGALGYKIVLKTNDKFDIYKVNTIVAAPNNCTNSQSQTGWGTWSINTTTLVTSNVPFPTNGLIFVEDNLWVEGTINGARLTIASGKFPDNSATRTSITVNNDLMYTNYDGQDVLSLIAQKDINVGLVSDTDLRIDAALIAQNGRIGRYYYGTSCKTGSNNWYIRNSIILYGMLGTYGRYGFAYTDNTGYITRQIIYDANLLYGPPPSFPLTSDQYTILSWEEIE